MEIVHSLAKWKRMAFANYKFKPNSGLYTDMNAIRPDDILDATHSIYVDQWDWGGYARGQRNLEYLEFVVRKIYRALKRIEFLVSEFFLSVNPLYLKRLNLSTLKIF